MLVCSCKAVTDRAVRQVLATGASSVDDIGAHCGAGTDCGTCISHLEDLLEEMSDRIDQIDRASAA